MTGGEAELEILSPGWGRPPADNAGAPGTWAPGASGAGRCSGVIHGTGPEFPARLGGRRAAGNDEAQGLPQGILIVIRHPAEQGHQLRAEPGYGVEDLPDVPEGPGRGLAGRAQEISRDLAAAHRHPDQAAHLRRGRQGRRAGDRSGCGPGAGPRPLPTDRRGLDESYSGQGIPA